MRPASFLPIWLVFLLGGCAATGSWSALVPVAGGEKISVPLGPGGPQPQRSAVAETAPVAFTMEPGTKALKFRFAFKWRADAAPRHVRIADITDRVEVFVDEANPRLEAQVWKGASVELSQGDPRLSWATTIDSTIRVFRFTFTTADGREVVMHQGSSFPAPAKAYIRKEFGLNY